MNRKVIGKAVVVTDSYLEHTLTETATHPASEIRNPIPEIPSTIEGSFHYTETGCLTVKNVATLKNFIGKTIGTTAWLDISQDVINKFADATLDHQWIHIDVERAKAESPFGRTVAHGLLSLSLLPYFSYQLLKIESAKLLVNYGYNKVRFISPVLSGHKIRAKMVLKSHRK